MKCRCKKRFVPRPLKLTLPAAHYNFTAGETSILTINVTFNQQEFSTYGGAFWAFDVGSEKYFTFANDFSKYGWGLQMGSGFRQPNYGIFTYPSCDAPDSVSGDASTLVSGLNGDGLRTELANGDSNNWYAMTWAVPNGQASSSEFKITNKYIIDTYEFEFNSKLDGKIRFNPSLGCQRLSSLPTGKDFNLYFSIDIDEYNNIPYQLEIASICVKKYV